MSRCCALQSGGRCAYSPTKQHALFSSLVKQMEGLEGPEGTQGLGGSPPPLKALGDAGAEGLFLGGLSQTGRKSRQWLASRARVCFVSTLSYAFSKHLPSASGGAGSVFTAGDIPEWVQCYSSQSAPGRAQG